MAVWVQVPLAVLGSKKETFVVSFLIYASSVQELT